MANGAALMVLLAGIVPMLDDPTAHARDALRAVMAGYVGLHLLMACGMSAFVLDQHRRGEIDTRMRGSQPHWPLWQDFTALTTLVTVAALIAQQGAA